MLKENLIALIEEEIAKNGNNCDLNHLDVSQVIDMSELFFSSTFTGDISAWNTSNVKDMNFMFCDSQFNGDISKWDTSNVKDMTRMFWKSQFNNNISAWNVSKVEDMSHMFSESQFKQDINKWMPYSLIYSKAIIDKELSPYWAQYHKVEERNKAITNYILSFKLNEKPFLKAKSKI